MAPCAILNGHGPLHSTAFSTTSVLHKYVRAQPTAFPPIRETAILLTLNPHGRMWELALGGSREATPGHGDAGTGSKPVTFILAPPSTRPWPRSGYTAAGGIEIYEQPCRMVQRPAGSLRGGGPLGKLPPVIGCTCLCSLGWSETPATQRTVWRWVVAVVRNLSEVFPRVKEGP